MESDAGVGAIELLTRFGYHRAHVLRDVAGLQADSLTLNFVAFGRDLGPYDASTATLGIQIVSNARDVDSGTRARIAEAATALSIPAVIAADTNWWALYAVTGLHELSLLQELQWVDDVGDLREHLSPGALLSAKLGSRQLSLFPAAVTVARQGRRVREETLEPRVADALRAAELTVDLPDAAQRQAHAARLVIGALTVVVLRDKQFDRTDRRSDSATSSDILVSQALSQHPQQFDWLPASGFAERDRLETLVGEFSDMDFGTVEPQMLSVLYENALVDDSVKRSIGVHYTPPGLARRLLAWLPVEEIEPKDRRVYDPTCGSGTLLVAAHDRIRDLQSPSLTPTASHQDLVTRIRGSDIDDVAVSIANLSLFLNALPAGNGWKIERSDVFGASLMSEPPTIMVANPPWQFQRVKHHDDLAQRVLARMMNWSPPGGLLGVVMPAGWLSWKSPAAVKSRATLFDMFDVIELWQLPAGAFEHADLGASVVLARRKGGKHAAPIRSIRRRISDRRKLSDFYELGVANALMTILEPQNLSAGPLRLWWSKNVPSEFTVSDYVKVVTGPQPESHTKLLSRSSGEPPNAALIEWGKVVPYTDVHGAPSRPVHFPTDMQNQSPRGQEMVGRAKVLASAAMRPDLPWRIKVAIDPIGDCLPKNTALAMLVRSPGPDQKPNHQLSEDTVLYGTFAFMASGFVSSWLDETVTTRNLGADVLTAIPAPSPSHMRQLAALGRKLAGAVDKTPILLAIDEKIWGYFRVPEGVLSTVIQRLNEGNAPEGKRRYPFSHAIEKRTVRVRTKRSDLQPMPPILRSGQVVAVQDQTVTLEIPGLTDGEEMGSLPSRMPGALLAPNSAFVVNDTGGSVDDIEFQFDELSYLDDSQVEEQLLRRLASSDEPT